MRYLGLDLGTKTLGIAISDNLGLIASSYKTIMFHELDYISLIPELKKIINEFDIKTIVLGFPKNMDNSIGYAAKRSLEFKKLLDIFQIIMGIEEEFDIKIELQDERLSSVEANNIMLMSDISRKKRKKHVDQLAATIILQSYLDSKKRGLL